MKQDKLLDAIGGVDETMLLESEQPVCCRHMKVGKLLLLAAVIGVLAVSVCAVSGVFSQPIHDSDIFIDEKAAPFTILDSSGDILPIPIRGLSVTMDVDVSENAPDYLQEYYLVDTPEGWNGSGMGTPAGRYYLSSWDQIFWKDACSERIELRQSTIHNYVSNEKHVDTLLKLTEEDGVTGQITQMAGLQVLKVTIPKLPRYDDFQEDIYCLNGETRLYWSDGRYILRFIYPAEVTDAEAEAILKTLHTEKVIVDLPEDYGKVNAQKLQDLNPLFYIEPGSTTPANIQMGQGIAALHNGMLYIGAPEQIIAYDLESGQQKHYVLGEKFADPKYLFVTDNYVGYVNNYDRLELLPLDGSATEMVAYEGIPSTCLYADGMTLYVQGDSLRRIDLTTGEIVRLAENVISYHIQGDTIYILQQGQNHFLLGKKGSTEFEKIPLDFYPIRVLAYGEDLYFCAGGEGTDYPVVHYRDGVTNKLPMNAWMYQICNGKLIYLEDGSRQHEVKAFDLTTGETETLQKNVFEFNLLQDRYLVCQLYNNGYEVHDLQTGAHFHIAD